MNNKVPDEFKKIYKVGNIIKRTYIFKPSPPKPDIITIKSVDLSVENRYGYHSHFTGYSYNRGFMIRCRTMYYKCEQNISDKLISYDEAVANIL